jgi:arylformamidase
MRIYDVSVLISPTLPVWPGDPQITLERISKIEQGANANVTYLSLSAHVGTHVDAPYHFLGDEHPTVDQLSLAMLTGRAYVLRIPDDVKVITAEVLSKVDLPSRTRRLIFKTHNSTYWAEDPLIFREDFVGLSPDGARYLVDRGIRLVGIDYLSIAPFHEGRPTHEILLGAGVVIVEGLNLSEVAPGRYTLYCLPLKLAGADGAPARAILIGV